MDPQTTSKVRDYVKETTAEGKDWSAVADAICFSLDKGTIVGPRSIIYDAKGDKVVGIKGMEVRNGVLQFKEKKKPIKAIVEEDDTPNPLIEQLRKSQPSRRRLAI